ncbi:MAG TPA: DUF2147 domain-containing protein [Steroidobacteraceae bacterium]
MLGTFALLPAAHSIAAAESASPVPAQAAPQRQSQPILGRWLTESRDGIIEITPAADGSYQGRIIGGDSPHRTDVKNPDASKRSALLLGQIILQDLTLKSPGHWSGGTIYDPGSGHTYRLNVELLDADHLKLRGFIGISLFGRTQVWERYTGTTLVLPRARH